MAWENHARSWPGQVAELALSAPSIQAFHTQLLAITARSCAAQSGGLLCMRGDGRPGAVTVLPGAGELMAALNRYCAEMTAQEIAAALKTQALTCRELLPGSLCVQASVVVRLWPGRGAAYRALVLVGPGDEPAEMFAERVTVILAPSFAVIPLAERLLEPLGKDHAELPERVATALGLTPAQHETLQLLVRGLTNREIADVLGISANTVRNRLAVCFKLLGASTRTEALFILNQAKDERSAISSHTA
ncbi:MAG TPA: helix-turn-helix transcriptional regulator [Polyangiales bacterium]|nr:helix-turn-helix transcriptional regulator [Polyangiales bacterium]